MANLSKSEQLQKDISGGQVCEGNAAGILRAVADVRQAHASVLENWDGEAAEAAKKAFARFDAELGRYEAMVGRFAKSYSEQGDRDAG